MTRFESAFNSLYARQTIATGVEVKATVQGSCEMKRAVISAVDKESGYVGGGVGNEDSYQIMMMASEFDRPPAKRASVTCNGPAEGTQLEVINYNINNGFYYLRVGSYTDPQNE